MQYDPKTQEEILRRAASILEQYRGLEALAEYAARLELYIAEKDEDEYGMPGLELDEINRDHYESERSHQLAERNHIVKLHKAFLREESPAAEGLFLEYARRVKQNYEPTDLTCVAVVKALEKKLGLSRGQLEELNRLLVSQLIADVVDSGDKFKVTLKG
jgi:hypothetical protein